MEKVELTNKEVQMIKNSRAKDDTSKYSIILNLNHNSNGLLVNIADDQYSETVCKFIVLILGYGHISNNLIKSKLSLRQIFKCLGISNNNSHSKRIVLNNTLNALGNIIKCDDLKRYASANIMYGINY